MSQGYSTAIRIAGQPCPPGHNKVVWYRYQQVARDTRLSRIDPALLPDSYCALYELTKMPDALLSGLVRYGVLSSRTTTRELKTIRITGKIPLTTTIWTEPGEYDDLVSRIEEIRGEFG
jgi:hypothetical protein